MRLFVALEIPEAQIHGLESMTGGIPGAHWIEPDAYHLTLRFIGEVDRGEAQEIDAMLAELAAPAFPVELAGVGQFDTGGRPRLLWAGVAARPGLRHLARKIDRAMVAAGLAPEERGFFPHVTLARLRDAPIPRVMRFLADHALFRAPPFIADRFVLFESRQGNGRAIYVPLADYPLRETPTAPADAAGERRPGAGAT
jgi:2'-5' RNA ligase